MAEAKVSKMTKHEKRRTPISTRAVTYAYFSR
jgi:hypothetical protein